MIAEASLTSSPGATAAGGRGTNVIAGYYAKTVTTGSRIDLDLALIERHLMNGEFEKARHVFIYGAHVDPYAKLHLEQQINADIAINHVIGNGDNGNNDNDAKIHVVGVSENEKHTIGNIRPPPISISFGVDKNVILHKGQTRIIVHYEDQDENGKHIAACAVGGRSEPSLEGCK